MRFTALALAASAIVLSACGGGDAAKDSANTATPATPTPATPATATAMPATGQVHTVRMTGTTDKFQFEPADIKVKAGDAIKFIMVSGGPHNVAFNAADIPADVRPQLHANMDKTETELSSVYLINPDESITISFAGIKPGTYAFHCTPHLMYNMKGTVTVE